MRSFFNEFRRSIGTLSSEWLLPCYAEDVAQFQALQLSPPSPSSGSPCYNPGVLDFFDLDAEVDIDLSRSSPSDSSASDSYSSGSFPSSASIDGDNFIDDIAMAD